MQLNENGAVSLIYKSAYHIWRSFVCDNISNAPSQTDLCSVMRVILIGAPIALAVNALTISWVVFAVIYLLFAFWLHVSVVGIVVLVILSIAALGAVFLFGGVLIQTAATAEITREIIGVIGTYYNAKKMHICPLISLTGDPQ